MVKPNNNKVNHTTVHFRVFHSLALAGRVPCFQVSWSIPRSSSYQLLLPWQCQGAIRQSAWQGHREQRLWPHWKRGEESCIIPISVSIQSRLRVHSPKSDLMPPRPHKKIVWQYIISKYQISNKFEQYISTPPLACATPSLHVSKQNFQIFSHGKHGLV